MKKAHDLTLQDKIYYYLSEHNELNRLAITELSLDSSSIIVKTASVHHSPSFDIRRDMKASFEIHNNGINYFTDEQEALKSIIVSTNNERAKALSMLEKIDSKLNNYKSRLNTQTHDTKTD